MEGESREKKKLRMLLEKAGIESSIRDIGNNLMEFSIPIYDETFASGIAYAGFPMNGDLPDEEKCKIVIDISSFVQKISQKLIYYTLDYLKESLDSERNSVAFAFLQRSAIFHICNHKLSSEGILTERHGKSFKLVDEYKTMPLARSVYEHLAMFYYLFIYPENINQQEIVWNSWILGNKRSLLKNDLPEIKHKKIEIQKEVEELIERLSNNPIVKECESNPQGKYKHCLDSNSIFSVVEKNGQYVAEKLTYDKAWRYLYGDRIDMSLLYKYLSNHAHPTYIGLSQFNSQDSHIEFPLYESCLFLSYLCRLFMQQLHIDKSVIEDSLSNRERGILQYLSNEINGNLKT